MNGQCKKCGAWDVDDTHECVLPKVKERWECVKTWRTARVMSGPIEGYVMCRFKGAMPFLVHVSNWHERFRRKS